MWTAMAAARSSSPNHSSCLGLIAFCIGLPFTGLYSSSMDNIAHALHLQEQNSRSNNKTNA